MKVFLVDLFITVLIGAGLAADAFAVAVAQSIASRKTSMKNSLVMAGSFGLFQAIMPIVGWLVGMQLITIIAGIDHWLAFGLLAFIGGKMIYESRVIRREEAKLDGYLLLLLSLATSMDALAVGLSLSFLEVSILEPAMIIGITTFIISLAGCLLGRRFGHLFEEKVEVAGGLILIGIGLKILVEHLLF